MSTTMATVKELSVRTISERLEEVVTAESLDGIVDTSGTVVEIARVLRPFSSVAKSPTTGSERHTDSL